tara:strand:+ start:6534 stop:6749 length:216 start_codon:yes stop_codon:yes gene_type:complete
MPVAIKGTGGGSVTLTASTAAADTTLTLPNITGTAVVSTAVSSSTTNTVTNKIAINIGGTVYYILASTSGT